MKAMKMKPGDEAMKMKKKKPGDEEAWR